MGQDGDKTAEPPDQIHTIFYAQCNNQKLPGSPDGKILNLILNWIHPDFHHLRLLALITLVIQTSGTLKFASQDPCRTSLTYMPKIAFGFPPSSCPVVLPFQPVFTSSTFITPSLPQFCEVPSLHRQASSEQEESTPWDTRNAEGAVQNNSCKMRALYCEVTKNCMHGKGASDRLLTTGAFSSNQAREKFYLSAHLLLYLFV